MCSPESVVPATAVWSLAKSGDTATASINGLRNALVGAQLSAGVVGTKNPGQRAGKDRQSEPSAPMVLDSEVTVPPSRADRRWAAGTRSDSVIGGKPQALTGHGHSPWTRSLFHALPKRQS